MFAAALQAGGQLQCLPFVNARQHQPLGKFGFAYRQGAGFVKGQHINFVGQFKRLRVFDEDSVFGSDACTRHDGGGCGQPQCARAGNHQHRHRMHHGQLKRMACEPPAQQRGEGNHQHHGYKYRTDFIDQALNGRFGGLSVFNQRDDLCQHGLASHSGDLHHDAAFAIDGTACELVAELFGNRKRLACQHGLIDLRQTLQQRAIDRKAFPRLDHNAVAHQHLSHGHIDFAIQAHQMRDIRAQGVQCANGGGRLPLGACLQPLAQQHKGNDDG